MAAPPVKSKKGYIEIDENFCKGCFLCVEDCPHQDIEIGEHLNRKGFHPAVPKNEKCTGCGICFYACPEPGAIRVYKLKPKKKRRDKEYALEDEED